MSRSPDQADGKAVVLIHRLGDVDAIAEVVVGMGLKRLPLLPSRHTFQMMAMAAVAVYEAAVENSREEE